MPANKASLKIIGRNAKNAMNSFGLAVLLVLSLFVVSHGQAPQKQATTIAIPQTAPSTAVPPAKVALVFPGFFSDEKEGITKMIAAYRQLNTEFRSKEQELQMLANRLQTLEDEIKKLTDANTVSAKQTEFERLQREMEFKKKEAEKAYQRRHSTLLNPVMDEIAAALKTFADAEGITMILDGDKLGNTLLTMTPAIDVTRAFIKFFNQKYPR